MKLIADLTPVNDARVKRTRQHTAVNIFGARTPKGRWYQTLKLSKPPKRLARALAATLPEAT